MFGRVLFILFLTTAQCTLPKDQEYWKKLAREEFEGSLSLQINNNIAKNVILFVGDGMGINTVTATRIYKGGASHRLAFEKFPFTGLLKTYSANKMVPDSASSGTALFSGVKVNQETVGVDATVERGDCAASLKPAARLDSLAAQFLKAGRRAGLVTTTRVTHATPSGLYAHSAYRKWECEATMPQDAAECKDIARQLVEDWPGRDLHVILGGGRQVLETNSTNTKEDPYDTWSCRRRDNRNLTEVYIQDKEKRNLKYSYVKNTRELKEIDHQNTDYLLGIFANGHLKYEDERNKRDEGMPSLTDMVEAAIKVLSSDQNGYYLMVEGGNIDMAHHRGWAKRALNEAAEMENAVQLALRVTDPKNTLILVTSDHGHTLSINGYPLRDSDITGIAQKSPYDGKNYTTLSYGTGGPDALHYHVVSDENGTKIARDEPSILVATRFDYKQPAGIILDENSHGGGDVAIYATGPHAHLFTGVHEQHYVYHAVCCAAHVGDTAGVCSGAHAHTNTLILYTIILAFIVIQMFL
ncbi:alkaline phosphatase, tissue-nonspecific isozyme-like isoform X1 [Manduca sexta]|uniref:alkaline phosphatase, tissue-nonspecific isozyme-like isoform X1 n=2 Tax=Manduca sexta TaxID=7130 RepID=UPI00188E87AF|nr:alkaline phosphatase, tissue-nonspecific isozyme-like isoform X1 [Manduca sexta]